MQQDDSSSVLVTASLDQAKPTKAEYCLLASAGYFVVVAAIVSLIHSLDLFNICNVTLMLLLGIGWIIGCRKLTELKRFVAEVGRENRRRQDTFQESKQELLERNDLLANVFRNSHFLVGAVEIEGDKVTSLFQNWAAQRFFANLTAADRTDRGERADAIQHWIELYHGSSWIKTPVSFEYECASPDGSRWLAVTISQAGKSEAENRFCYFAEDITEQKKVQKAHNQNQEQLTDILDIQPDAIFSLDANWRVTFMNSQAVSVLGHGREILGRVFWDIFPELAEGEIWQEYFRAMQDRIPVEFDVFQAGDQRLQTRALPCRGGLAIFLRDVTVDRQTMDGYAERERQLRRHLAELERQCHTAPMCLALFDQDLRFMRVNETMAELNGVRIEAALGRRFADVAPYWYDCIAPTLKSALANGQAACADFISAKQKPGEPWHDCHISARPIFDEASSVSGVSLILLDTTVERRAERMLRDSEQRFRQLADGLPDIIWTADSSGNVDYCNARWFAYTSSDANGSPEWSSFIHPSHLEHWQASWAQCMLAGERYETEYQLRRHDGAYRWFLCQAQGIFDSDGQVLKWIGTCTDIHDQKHQTLALEDSNQNLKLLTAAVTPALEQRKGPGVALAGASRELDLLPAKPGALSKSA